MVREYAFNLLKLSEREHEYIQNYSKCGWGARRDFETD